MALDADELQYERGHGPSQLNGDNISGSRYRILGMTIGAVWIPLIFGHDVPGGVKPEEFGESTIEKRRYERAPEGDYLLSPLRARPWNRHVGIEAAAICLQVTGAKEPVKAAQEAAGKVFASTAGPAPDQSRFWLNKGRAMPKSPCCGSSSWDPWSRSPALYHSPGAGA